MDNKKKVTIIAVGILALAAIIFGAVALMRSGRVQVGAKEITVVVVEGGETVATHVEHTDAEYLGELLLDSGIAKGETSDYGLFITEVDGIAADSSAEEWWCITKGNEDVFTGADTTPIADGETYELTLTVGYSW